MSSYLVDELRPGDSLELRGPVGGFFVWEAALGGPFCSSRAVGCRSVTVDRRHHLAVDSDVPLRLLYSARALDDVLYRDELTGWRPPTTSTSASRSPANGPTDGRDTVTHRRRAARGGRLADGRASPRVRLRTPAFVETAPRPSSTSATTPAGSGPSVSAPPEVDRDNDRQQSSTTHTACRRCRWRSGSRRRRRFISGCRSSARSVWRPRLPGTTGGTLRSTSMSVG